MITAMRKHAQSWVIKLMLILVAVTFVVSFSIGQFTQSRTVVARVGTHEILIKEFNREYEKELDRLRERFGENTDAVAAQLNIRKQVFDRMLHRQLILAAARDQGLVVTEEELTQAITGQSFFRINDRFDFSTYRAVLAQNRITPEAFEQQTRNDLKAQKYQRNLLAGLVVGKEEVEQRYRIENEKVRLEAILMEPEAFRKTVASDAEAERAYYEAHKDEFTRPDQFKLNYFVLSLNTVEARVKLKERALQRYYERNKDDRFSTPKKVRASHILKKLATDAPEEVVAKARAALEKVRQEAKSGGNFAALAKKYSQDLTGNKGGDLGLFTQEDMLPEFSQAAFALRPGEVSGIVRTNFGLHLIKVTEVKPGVVKSFDQARPEIEKILRGRRAERKLKLEGGRLPQRISQEGLEAVAKEWDRKLLSTDWIDGTGSLAKLGSSRNLYELIRNGQDGDGGVWRRNPVRGHVFYQITEKKGSYLKPLAEVQKQVTEKVLAGRMEDAALQEAKKVYKSIKTYDDFKAVAKKRGLNILTTEFSSIERAIPGVGTNREFLETAFKLSPDQPIGLSIDEKTAHLMYLKKRYFPNPEEADQTKLGITARIQREWAQYFLESELERLKQEIEIEIVTPELVSSL